MCQRGSTYSISFNLHNNLVVLLLLSRKRAGDWGPEMLGNLHQVTANKRMGLENRHHWLQTTLNHHCLLHKPSPIILVKCTHPAVAYMLCTCVGRYSLFPWEAYA